MDNKKTRGEKNNSQTILYLELGCNVKQNRQKQSRITAKLYSTWSLGAIHNKKRQIKRRITTKLYSTWSLSERHSRKDKRGEEEEYDHLYLESGNTISDLHLLSSHEQNSKT